MCAVVLNVVRNGCSGFQSGAHRQDRCHQNFISGSQVALGTQLQPVRLGPSTAKHSFGNYPFPSWTRKIIDRCTACKPAATNWAPRRPLQSPLFYPFPPPCGASPSGLALIVRSRVYSRQCWPVKENFLTQVSRQAQTTQMLASRASGFRSMSGSGIAPEVGGPQGAVNFIADGLGPAGQLLGARSARPRPGPGTRPGRPP